MDEREGLPSYPDNFFDLAIVDPPYGLDIGNSPRIVTDKGIKGKSWDSMIPDREYFEQLNRVSKNQIIWGWNYFVPFLSSCQCYIVWYKHQPVKSFADCESAYTSFKRPAVVFDFRYYGNIEGGTKASLKIHPTQKPIKLYQRTLTEFAKPGDLILDTHVGSASSLIAFESMGFNYHAFEIDEDYYKAALERMRAGIQTAIF